MSHISERERQRLVGIAEEVREQDGHEGHLVGSALGLHRAFRRNRRSGSSLARDMIMESVARGARKAGLDPEHVTGGALEIVAEDNGVFRRYRLKTATKLRDGTYKMLHNGESAFAEPNDDLFQSECWVLGYTLLSEYQIGDIFVAEVLEVLSGKPGRLILGTPVLLSSTTLSTPPDFTSTDEDLDDEDDLDDLDDPQSETGGEGLGEAS